MSSNIFDVLTSDQGAIDLAQPMLVLENVQGSVAETFPIITHQNATAQHSDNQLPSLRHSVNQPPTDHTTVPFLEQSYGSPTEAHHLS